MCALTARSHDGLRSSRNTIKQSNLLNNGGANPVFTARLDPISNCPPFGFVAPITVVRVRSVVTMPALATLSVCCSIASCIVARSASRIESNSSMQHTPPSARTNAPASSAHSPDSFVAATVRPAALEPIPVVIIARGATAAAYFKSCDLPMPGSPTRRMCDSPRTRPPLESRLGTPPMSASISASFGVAMPKSCGHMARKIISRA
mmetsp:Transcript_1662/g.6607  ORF Transcript_1662/g.6607 Transcript_1662/m.6607 type:complete len:206 (+) Transcript_1662:406-1023(+)